MSQNEKKESLKDKAKAFFDNKATWLTIGAFVGTVLGDKAALIAQGIGAVIMAVL